MQLNSFNLFKITLLFYTLFGMHIISPSPLGTGLYITFNMIGWGVISILIGLGFWNIYKNKTIVISKIHYFVFGGLTFLLIPVFFEHSSFYLFFPRFISVVGAVILLFGLYQFNGKDRYKFEIIFILFLGIIIESFIGISQFYLIEAFEYKEFIYPLASERPSGVFLQPNVMGSFMVTGLVLGLYLCYLHFNNIYKYRWINLIYLGLFTCSVMIVLLQSKTAYLGLLVSFLLILPILFKQFTVFKKALILISVGLIVGGISFKYIQKFERGEQIYKEVGIRFDVMAVSLEMFKESPFTGTGYGKFERSYRESHVNQMKSNSSLGNPGSNLDHPHNEVLYWGVEGGVLPIIGLLSFAFGFILMFKKRFTPQNLLLLSLIIPIFIHTQTELPFYLSVTHLMYFIIIIWFIDISVRTPKIKVIQGGNLAKVASFIIPLIVLPFMVTALHTAYLFSKFQESEFKETKYLAEIINTMVWQDYLERVNQNLLYYKGVIEGDPNLLIEYIVWGVKYTEVSPKENIYQKMMTAITILENNSIQIDTKLTERVKKEAKVFFPNKTNWTPK